jgi:phosphate transport system protein
MLRRSLDAFVEQDLEVARSLPSEDDEVDELYNKIQRDLLNILLEKPILIDRANYILWAAHNLERAADRVTNICERIIFTVTGELVEMDAS